MWTLPIIVQAPILNDKLGFPTIGDQGPIQTFSPEMTLEALDKRIFPGTVRGDVQRLTVTLGEPILKGIGDKLGAVIAAQVPRRTSREKELLQHVNDLA